MRIKSRVKTGRWLWHDERLGTALFNRHEIVLIRDVFLDHINKMTKSIDPEHPEKYNQALITEILRANDIVKKIDVQMNYVSRTVKMEHLEKYKKRIKRQKG